MLDAFDLEAAREGFAVSRAFHVGSSGGRVSRHRVSHHSPVVKRRKRPVNKLKGQVLKGQDIAALVRNIREKSNG